MAQTILLSNSSAHMMPNSPDPTPLRMLAFSVAEAALSSDPNSPLFLAQHKVASAPRFMDENGDWDEAFRAGWKEWNGGVKAAPRSKAVWDVVQKAKERKERNHFIENAPTSPVSPGSYNFVLPPTSQLAASIARQQDTCKPTRPFMKRPLGLYETQSAEPSPTRSTFSTLDQTRPPPEFVPRLSAVEFVQQADKTSADVAAVRERRRSTIEPLSAAKLAEHTAAAAKTTRRARLPSLQQIQARVTVTSRLRRSGSVDALPSVRPQSPRTFSTDSVESFVLTTPPDEIPNPLLSRRLALQRIMEKRPATPPSPPAGEARLALFLRERTNGRIASGSKVTPEKTSKPILRVTPPSLETRPAVPPLHLGRATQVTPTKSTFPFRSGFSTPTETRFAHPFSHLSTPPRSGSPVSPTTSFHSAQSGSSGMHGSPTPSVPIITCTPAQDVPEGSDQESDDGSSASGEYTLCDPDAELRAQEEKEAQEMMEREVRGMAMRAALSRRRASDSE